MRQTLAAVLTLSTIGGALPIEAPSFELMSSDGKTVKLSDFKGKPVVLEWFNPECPYVQASHTKGSLVGLAAELKKRGIVWLAVNSGAPGKQGFGAEKNNAARKQFKIDHPVLLDEQGTVGKAYGATNTPHLFVISKEGQIVYRGSIDNSPDGEGLSPNTGTLVNHVKTAIDEVLDGKPVQTPETKAYGCSVKYGS